MNMSKTVWPENTNKIITVITKYDSVIKAFYKRRGTTDPFQAIESGFAYKNDDVWELVTKFPSGEYMLKIVIDGIEEISFLEVVPTEIYNQSLVLKLIQEDLKNLTSRIASKLSFKVSG